MHTLRPLANGISTDHPVPDLPFVDDTHLPLTDPRALEAVGRHAGEGMWGRCDEWNGGWLAFTTDPIRRDLAWCVRYHPEHGRSVLVYSDADASGVHMDWWGDALLFRSGGYWWDGSTWYRPSQVWNGARESYDARPVPAAVTVTADDLVDDAADAEQGRLLKIANLDSDVPVPARWLDDLALWAARRTERREGRPLSDCVVRVSAPELAGDQLVGITEMAEIGGIAPSTLRAYISRNEGDVPPAQATINGRNAWARPVAREWAEQRRRSPESVTAAVSTDETGFSLPVGAAEVQRHSSKMFFSLLWEHQDRRKRWALRHRTPDAVRQVSDELGWAVATNLTNIIPTDALAETIRHALWDEFATGQQAELVVSQAHGRDMSLGFYGITPGVARMLDWLVRTHPHYAQRTIDEIIGEAERRLGIPYEVSTESLRTALMLDGDLTESARKEFLDRVLPPTPTSTARQGRG